MVAKKKNITAAAADFVAAVDPDCDRSGLALIRRKTREIRISEEHFCELLQDLLECEKRAEAGGFSFVVVVEAGWLNSGNWHVSPHDNKWLAAQKGRAVGRNHQTGILIVEMLQSLGIATELAPPLRKCWKGKDRKITKAELEEVTGQKLPRNNQEGRDAALLAWVYAGLPVRISGSEKPKFQRS